MRRISKPALGLLLAALIFMPAACAATLALASASVTAATSDCWQPTPSPSSTPSGAESPAPQSPEPSEPTWCDPAPTGGGLPRIDIGQISAPNADAATAVAAALVAVSRGGRYVAEGNGPVDFDCSGLTAFAWRAAGVSLVDYSYAQWDQTQRIPRSALAPGDLVFWFGGDVHHVAIVTAVDGAQVTIAEAANPTDGIRTRLLGGGWDEAYLSGFGRVVAA